MTPPTPSTPQALQAPQVGLDPPTRWRLLAVLGLGELLAMSPWFSASAVAPLITVQLNLSGLDLPLLTIAVQLGFVLGALLIAVTGAADVLPARALFLAGAVAAAVSNLGFAYVAGDFGSAVAFRFVTGFALAGVYPVGMKIVVGWFRRERGLAIGVLVGALTVGASLPYLFRALGALSGLDWRAIVASASVAGLLGGLLVGLTVRRGPFDVAAPRFSVAVARRAFAEPSVRLANLGYLGHMWELYAMWTWIPLFFAASFTAAGLADPAAASFAAFVVVAAGGVGCAAAGLAADRIGRTTLTIGAMAVSGTSAVAIGFLFGAPPALTLVVGIVWGVSVVADSAQFSAAITELGPPGTAGSALALQTASGFLLTGVTIMIIGVLSTTDALGWRLVFALLALGPLVGITAMWRLRGRPEASRMANGHR
jgi:MFS family permease